MTRKYETIHRQEHSYPVALMCQWAGVSKSGYYSWRSRPESATTTRRRRLTLFIKTEFSASDGTYGYRRITAALWRRGVVVDRDTVRSIMREQGLVAAQPRRKDPAPPSRPRTWARVPTWSSGTSPPASRE